MKLDESHANGGPAITQIFSEKGVPQLYGWVGNIRKHNGHGVQAKAQPRRHSLHV